MTPNQTQALLGFDEDFDFWSLSSRGADILSSPDSLEKLESVLKGINADFEVAYDDIPKLIEEGGKVTGTSVLRNGLRRGFDLSKYNNHANAS